MINPTGLKTARPRITSTDHAGHVCQLVDINGNYVHKGDQFRDSHGDTDMVMSGVAPRNASSAGYVHRASGGFSGAGVYNLKWVRV